jgi:hypothetical protein
MHKINERAQRLQDLFGSVAEKIAQQTQFIQRTRKITPLAWLLATVLGWMNNKNGTLNTIVENFEQQGIEITEQGVSKRFTSHAVDFFKQMIVQACKLLVNHDAENLPLIERFNGVYVEDCSTVRLPSDLIDKLPGCGGNGSEEKGAAIKTFCRIELVSGNFSEMIFGAGKTSDFKLANQAQPLPKGALHLADMGFFDLERLRQEDAQGVHWITRIPAGTLIEIDGIQQSIGTYLSTIKDDRVDLSAWLGKERLRIRFIALRAPESTIRQRRVRLTKEAKKKGRSVSQEQLSLCGWTVFATNLPVLEYTADEVYTLYRIRWQIELVFKLWKSEGGVATSHGKTGTRCLCEFLAKLLGQIIANWLMLLRGGRLSEVSPTRLYRQVSRSVPDIAEALTLKNEEALISAMDKLLKRLERIKPKQRRKKQPSARQTLCENVTYALS